MKPLHVLLNEMTASVAGQDLAKAIGKSASYVTQIRSGHQIPTDRIVTLVAREFGPNGLAELLLAAGADRIRAQLQRDAAKLNGKALGEAKELTALALGALDRLGQGLQLPADRQVKQTGRTLEDFPEAFYPLTVVTGDKREERGAHISIADFGAFTATPADTRWLANLGLRGDVVKHIDKNFLLLDERRLHERFAETNLLVIGSPAANHLARMANRSAVLRFNYSSDADQAIEAAIDRARKLTRAELPGYYEKDREELKRRMRALFTGGIFDPTYPDGFVAAQYAQLAANTQFDFGVLTFAANPFYAARYRDDPEANDHKYVSIIAAGIHHPATAHAVRQLGRDQRDKGVFARHPYGGVLRVVLDLSIPFSERVERAECLWEDAANPNRSRSDDQKADLVRQLTQIEAKLAKGELKNLELSADRARACRVLIERL